MSLRAAAAGAFPGRLALPRQQGHRAGWPGVSAATRLPIFDTPLPGAGRPGRPGRPGTTGHAAGPSAFHRAYRAPAAGRHGHCLMGSTPQASKFSVLRSSNNFAITSSVPHIITLPPGYRITMLCIPAFIAASIASAGHHHRCATTPPPAPPPLWGRHRAARFSLPFSIIYRVRIRRFTPFHSSRLAQQHSAISHNISGASPARRGLRFWRSAG